MAKSKAKNAKRAKNAAKHNSVEAEEAKAVKKGEEIVDDEELENVVEDEEIEDEEVDEEDESEEDEDIDAEEDDDDEEDEDEEDDEDESDEDKDDDESEEEDDESEDEDEESEDEDESEDDGDEDEDEDEDEDDEEDDDDLDDESEEEESEEDNEEEEDEEDEEDEDDEEEEEPKVVTKKKSSKKASKKAKAEFKNNVKKNKSAKVTTKIISSKAKPSAVKTFFARKGDENENILTIFKDTRIIGAIVGEIFGTAIITMIALTLGLFNPLYMILAYVGITLAIVKLSGAHLNPIVTAGMMASRRVSAVRGVIYIISQVLGSWLGFLVINGFYQAGINSGNIEAATSVLPTLTATSDLVAANADYSFFWAVTMVEFIGAIIIAFFFARAQRVKENKVAFAITVSAGVFVAMLLAVVINSNFFGQQSNTFVLNPAVGMMYGIFPASAEGVDSLMNALMPMLVTYVIFPVFGGVLGFYLSDFANLMEGKDLKDNIEE